MAALCRSGVSRERMARVLASSLRRTAVSPRCAPVARKEQLIPLQDARNSYFSASFIEEQYGFLTAKSAYGVRSYSSGGLPPHEVLTMPALSPTMTQGNVGKWKKKEGETVAAGDVLCDIETDKATLDFESLEDGVLAKILIPAGTKDVPVGQALCVVAESAEGVEQFASYSAGAGPTPSPQLKQQAPPSSPPATAPSPSPQRSPPSDLPPHEVLTMPALSPTMTQGNVGKWKKKEGDMVAAGDVLCDIETDKATLDFESLEDGVLAKILIPAGTKDIPVGQALCVVAESKEGLEKFTSYSQEEDGQIASQASQPQEQARPSSHSPPPPHPSFPPVDLPPHEVLSMPALSPTMTQGNVGTWKKKEGDKVAAGDVLCDIETDKATLDFESLEDGVMAKILIPSGTKDVQVGRGLCVIAESDQELEKFASYSSEASTPSASGQSPKAAEGQSQAHAPATPAPLSSSAVQGKFGPAVRKLLAESGLDASQLTGTGPHGMLVKGDVLAAMKSGVLPKSKSTPAAASKISAPAKVPAASSPALSYEDIPTSQIRKIIAKRLVESKSGIPHAYLEAATLLDPTLDLRKELKENHGVSISVNDFIIRATALALKEVPEANAFWDDKAGTRVKNNSIDICVAVATDKGLMTPILKNADQKSLSDISSEVKSLAERARAGKLKPNEFQGGTFSISNLGMFSVDHFSAIINPPQACILAVGRGVKKVVWEEDADGGGRPKTVTQMLVTLSVDHRVYDGETGGRFLKALHANLSDPKRMLL
ncbi:unnamed protein product [Sphagnum jensenii]|uniref:Acetyltransferase component of pyruvate dehydrogenase complex n=1 Tax=Sphagnum jensenii TaxID=128206 RepID=A0ABP0WW95_9BRYO